MRDNSLRAGFITLDLQMVNASAVCSAQSELFFRLLLKNTVCGTQKRLVQIFGKLLRWSTIPSNKKRIVVLPVNRDDSTPNSKCLPVTL